MLEAKTTTSQCSPRPLAAHPKLFCAPRLPKLQKLARRSLAALRTKKRTRRSLGATRRDKSSNKLASSNFLRVNFNRCSFFCFTFKTWLANFFALESSLRFFFKSAICANKSFDVERLSLSLAQPLALHPQTRQRRPRLQPPLVT